MGEYCMAMLTTKRRGYLTPREAAAEIGVSYTTLWVWRQNGKARTVKVQGTSVEQFTLREVARLKKMWEERNSGN